MIAIGTYVCTYVQCNLHILLCIEDGLAGWTSCSSYIAPAGTHLHPWSTSLKAPSTTEAKNCPPVMKATLRTTSLPRMLAGEDSAMYSGTDMEERPVGRVGTML